MAEQYGYQAQLGISASNPVDARFDFHMENLVTDEEFVDTNGLRGTRERDISRVRQGNYRVHGQIHFQPSPVELALLLPWILGTAASGTTYALAEALAQRYVTVDRGPKVSTYAGCAVDKCTIRGQQGKALDVTLDVVGQTETLGNSGTFPALSIDTTTAPFMFTDLVMSVGGVAYTVKDLDITIDNVMDKERFYNSQTLSAVIGKDRHINVQTHLPYGTASAVYGSGPGGVAVVCTFTGTGTAVLTMTFVKVAFPRKSPSYAAGREEEMVPLMGEAHKSSGTLSLVTTLSV